MPTEDWTAMYMPSSDRPDPTRSGFPSEDAAWEFVFARMCKGCKQERAFALAGTWSPEEWPNDYDPSAHPACSAEWDVLTTEEFRSLGKEAT